MTNAVVMCGLLMVCVFVDAAGSPEVRVRSAERCTGWRTETCGAQRAAGRKPARGLWTELPRKKGRGFLRLQNCFGSTSYTTISTILHFLAWTQDLKQNSSNIPSALAKNSEKGE